MNDRKDDASLLIIPHGQISVRRDALEFTFVRSAGPGGQAVNKVSTAVEMRVAVESISGLSNRALARLRSSTSAKFGADGRLVFRSRTHRSQWQNRQACEEKLVALLLGIAPEPRVRRKTKPTRGSIERRLEGKRRRSEQKRSRGRGGDDS